MKTLALFFILVASIVHADVKVSQLPLGSAASTNVNDSFPYVSSTTNTTQRLKLSDLINLPQMVATYAPLASPTFTGTVTAPTIVLSTGATIGYCWEATSTGGAGAWAACSSFVNPMSAVGDLIYGGASGAATRLAANTSATKAFLTETGTGSAGQAPSWQLGLSSGDIPNNAANTTGSAGSLTQSLTANEPVIGNGTGITVGTKSGNTTDFVTANGALTSGDCLQADANGNIQTTGSACGSAGGGVTTVGTYNSQTSNANGAVISGSDIYFQPFTSANPGMAPASGGGTTNFLRADGTWAAPAGGGGTPGGANTDVQYNSSGSFAGDSGMTYDGAGNLTLSAKINATTANLSNLTASEVVETDGSKNLISAASLSAGLGGLGTTTTPTDGQIPIGSTSSGHYAPATLTAGSGISITNGAGSVTVSALVPNSNQYHLVGTISWAPTSGCFWTGASSTTPGNFGVQSSCPTPTVTGGVTAPGTKIPAAVLASMPAGDYFFVGVGEFGCGADTVGCAVDYSDGTNVSSIAEYGNSGGSTAPWGVPQVDGYLHESSNQTNVTVQLQGGDSASAGNTFIYANHQAGFQIQVWYAPSAATMLNHWAGLVTCSSSSSITNNPNSWMASIGNITGSYDCAITLTSGICSATPISVNATLQGSSAGSTVLTANATSSTNINLYGSGSPSSFSAYVTADCAP